MALLKVGLHVSDGCIQVVHDETSHLVTRLTMAGSHEHGLVIGQSLGQDRQVAILLQHVEVSIGTEEINLAHILTDVGLVAADGVLGQLGLELSQLIVHVADVTPRPVALALGGVPQIGREFDAWCAGCLNVGIVIVSVGSVVPTAMTRHDVLIKTVCYSLHLILAGVEILWCQR